MLIEGRILGIHCSCLGSLRERLDLEAVLVGSMVDRYHGHLTDRLLDCAVVALPNVSVRGRHVVHVTRAVRAFVFGFGKRKVPLLV